MRDHIHSRIIATHPEGGIRPASPEGWASNRTDVISSALFNALGLDPENGGIEWTGHGTGDAIITLKGFDLRLVTHTPEDAHYVLERPSVEPNEAGYTVHFTLSNVSLDDVYIDSYTVEEALENMSDDLEAHAQDAAYNHEGLEVSDVSGISCSDINVDITCDIEGTLTVTTDELEDSYPDDDALEDAVRGAAEKVLKGAYSSGTSWRPMSVDINSVEAI